MPADSKQPQTRASGQAELERLKAQQWSPKGREERILRAMRALNGPKPTFILSREEWKTIAEDPNLEEG